MSSQYVSDALHVIFNLYNHSAKYYFLLIIHMIKLKHSSLPEVTELEGAELDSNSVLTLKSKLLPVSIFPVQ